MQCEIKRYKPVTKGVEWIFSTISPLLYSPYGQKAFKQLRPAKSKDARQLNATLDELSVLVDYFKKNMSLCYEMNRIFMSLRNICGSLANLTEQTTLDEIELFETKNFSLLISELKLVYERSKIKLKSIWFEDLKPVISILNPDSIVISSFFIHDAYSVKLADLRKEKHRLEKEILKSENDLIKDSFRTKRSLIVQAEREEELCVRTELSSKLAKYLPQLRHNTEIAGNLELLIAKAIIAIRWQGSQPELIPIDSNEGMEVEAAVNPEIIEILTHHEKKFTPVSIKIIRGTTLLTGANMGGKTVALTTIAMNAELVLLGFFAFAAKFKMPVFDFIHIIAGDSQDQNSGLSTFGGEIIKLAKLSEVIKSSTGLAICDEFARSTNPSEGRRFVQALSDYMHESNSYGIIATHYDGIKTEGAAFYQVAGLKNKDIILNASASASAFDNRDIALDSLCKNMDYNLVRVDSNYEVPKDALNIAITLGIDTNFLDILKKLY